MALALVAGAIFYGQAASPAGFLSAYRQTEVSRISEATAAGSTNKTTWEDLRKAIAGRIANTALAVRHDALNNLVNSVIRADELPGTVSMADADESARKDSGNMLSALCAAVVFDASSSKSLSSGAGGTASQPANMADSAELRTRFAGVELRVRRAMVEPRRTSLYNDDIAAVRRDAMTVYFSRADVLSATGEFADFFAIKGHFTALPIIQRRLNALATALDSAGLMTEAKQCRAWLRRCLWDLLTSERDPATRLLCADLLSTQVDLDAGSVQTLRRLIADYQERAASAPNDRADPASRSPAVLPDQYRTVLNRLATALSATLAGVGAWLAALICLLAALVTRRRSTLSNDETYNESTQPLPTVNWLHAAVTGLAIAVACMGLRLYVSGRGISENWAFVSAIVSMAVGFVIPVMFPPQYWDRPMRTVIAMALALGLFSVVFVTPTTIGWVLRGVLFQSHPLIVVAVIAHLICFASLFISTAAWRRKANWAAIFSLVWLGLGLVGYQFHRVADDAYLSRVAEARADQFASRLGSDWQDRYLSDVKKTILEDRP